MSAAGDHEDAAVRRGGMPARRRRLARILAFQTLYEMDVSRHRPGEVLQRRLTDEQADSEVASFSRELVSGVLRERAAIDEVLQANASAFPLTQMAAVDRNILRLALYECLYTSQQVPVRVAINEAVELAKEYGSDSSGRFVNGVLGSVMRSRQQEADAPPSDGSEPGARPSGEAAG